MFLCLWVIVGDVLSDDFLWWVGCNIFWMMMKEMSVYNVECVLLVVKIIVCDVVDVEIVDCVCYVGGEGEVMLIVWGKWLIVGRAVLAVACATFAAVGVARVFIVCCGGEVVMLFFELGGVLEWCRDFVVGKIVLGWKFSDTVSSKTCVR